MIVVHHLDHSQSFRIVWLLEELKSHDCGVDYELKLYKRTHVERMAPPEYKSLSPLGTSPTITTSDGLIMNESNAIMDYILDLAGSNESLTLRPTPSSPSRSSYLFWFHCVQGSMQPMLTVDIVFRRASKKTPCPLSSIVSLVGSKVRDALVLPRLRNIMELAEQQLQKSNYLAGNDLTAADISAIYPFSSLLTRYPELSSTYPHCQAWLSRVSRRPAFRAAQEKMGEQDGIVFESE